jgi:hypothetical protein
MKLVKPGERRAGLYQAGLRKGLYFEPMKNFACPKCGKWEQFDYRKFDDMLVCSCGCKVQRADALSGHPLWVQKDGEAIDVRRMTHDHLSYAMAMLITRPDFRHGWLEILTSELERRRKENAGYGDPALKNHPSIQVAEPDPQKVELDRVTGNKPTAPGTEPGGNIQRHDVKSSTGDD